MKKKMVVNNLVVPVEVYSRVVGYYRPTSQWNKGKQEEFKDRKEMSNEKITEFLEKVRSEHMENNC